MASVTRGIAASFRWKNLIVNSAFSRHRIIPYAAIHKSRWLYDSKGQEIKMPSLSPTMTEGTIVRWLKKEGDIISPGDVLCEIQTDKAVVGFEVEEEGILAKILVPDDTKDVKIGSLIGVMVDSGEDWKNVQIREPVGEISDTQVQSTLSETATQGMEIKMPSLSPTMTEGTIVKWLKKEGDTISPGDVLCEIQTDKAVVGFETEEEGVLAKILVPEDTKEVQLGMVIAIMVSEGEDWRNVSSTTPEVQEVGKHHVGEKASLPSISKFDDPMKLCGPSVRNLLHEYGIEYNVVPPTGPHNVLLKGDVLKYINVNNLKPHPKEEKKDKVMTVSSAPDITFIEEQQYIDIPLTSMRQTIAKRLTESKTKIPHAFMSIDCTMNEVTKLRSKMKEKGIAVSVNDFIIKSAALSLKTVPEVNVVWDKDQPKMVDFVDISIAVAIDKGLITPIVKQANNLAVPEISECVKELALRAKQGKLKPDEYLGGSFSISNLGMFGISEFTAVINPPQAAILSVGTSRVVLAPNKQLETKMTVTLNYDRRVIDEAIAGKFLQCLKQYMEDPVAMIYGSSLKNFGKNPLELFGRIKNNSASA